MPLHFQHGNEAAKAGESQGRTERRTVQRGLLQIPPNKGRAQDRMPRPVIGLV